MLSYGILSAMTRYPRKSIGKSSIRMSRSRIFRALVDRDLKVASTLDEVEPPSEDQVRIMLPKGRRVSIIFMKTSR